ncbi:MAG TPA: hypothetical protein VMQ52_04665 [Candidatus Saccharimonadales bacterium]|jgi:hypothetical protein|nr:hypothetical protein [Candidatus Saccharimonadales bacterium]
MIKRFFSNYPAFTKLIITLVGVVFIGGLVIATPVTAARTSENSVCGGIGIVSGGNGTSSGCSSGESLHGVLADILNILSVVAGFIAVIMIIIGGLRYVMSGGNDNAVASAKNLIIYAIVGIIVVAIAQAIVHFILGASGL